METQILFMNDTNINTIILNVEDLTSFHLESLAKFSLGRSKKSQSGSPDLGWDKKV
jgi:hypothetical protein